MKRRGYETDHDHNLGCAKFCGIIIVLIVVYETAKGTFLGIKGLLNGNNFGGEFIKSLLAGKGIGLIILMLLFSACFFIDWAIYAHIRKKIINKGIRHDGMIVSEIEKRKGGKCPYLTWKYVVKLDDGSTVKSTAYSEQIYENYCTVYVLGSKCVLTDFRSQKEQ